MREFEEGVVFSFKRKNNMLDIENELTGKLYVSNTDGITIEYTKSIKNPKEVFESLSNTKTTSFIVYGQIAGGKKFTAYECYKGRGSTNFMVNGVMTEKCTIEVGSLYIGEWLGEKSLLKIDKAKVRFSYLERWFQEIRVNDGVLTNKPNHIEIALNQFSKDFNAKIDDNLTISETHKWQNKTELGKKNIFEITQYIQCNFVEAVDVETYQQTIYKLHNFFRLIMPQANIYIEEEYIAVQDTNIEICVANKHYTKENDKISRTSFLYLFDEETISHTLKTWFLQYQKYGRVFNLLSSILDNPPFMYIEHSFLNIVQWYEGYCRLTYQPEQTEIIEFNNQLCRILMQINREKDKKLIQDITRYGYEVPLKKQGSRQLKRFFSEDF